MTELTTIADRVKAARLARRWGVEKAAREADVSSITWKRVENALPVRETSLVSVMDALGLSVAGDRRHHDRGEHPDLADLLANEPTLTPDAREHIVRQFRLLQRLSELEVTPEFARQVDQDAIRTSRELTPAQKAAALEAEAEARTSPEAPAQEPKGRRRGRRSG